jgi:hypothetical protein
MAFDSAALRTAWDEAMSAPAFSDPGYDSSSSPWYVATDSSDTMAGFMTFFVNQKKLFDVSEKGDYDTARWSWPLNGVKQQDHIYLKELRAAVDALKAFWASHPGEGVNLVGDNTAVMWGLRQGFSTNRRGLAMIGELAPCLHLINCVQVVSRDNPADCPSRDRWDDVAERVERLEKAVEGLQHGIRTSAPSAYDVHQDEILRHSAPTDAEYPLWQEDAALWDIESNEIWEQGAS